MLNVGTIQVVSGRWVGAAIDANDGRLVACTTPTSSTQAAKADVLESLRRFGWSPEQVIFQATDNVASAAQRLWELFQGRGAPFRLEEISLVRWTQARIEVSRQLLQIPKGRAVSYGSLAKRAGSSPRGVGMVMATNPVPLAVPCHRVIHADGRLGKFGRTTAGTRVKAAILLAEGVSSHDEERIDLGLLVR
jgi:methylated-DNA-[protein]-cysteine S-methyltransferase